MCEPSHCTLVALQIGDSMQRQLFTSLACLLNKAKAQKEGYLGSWEEHGPKLSKEYTSRGLGSAEERVALQYAGRMVLHNGVVKAKYHYHDIPELWQVEKALKE